MQILGVLAVLFMAVAGIVGMSIVVFKHKSYIPLLLVACILINVVGTIAINNIVG